MLDKLPDILLQFLTVEQWRVLIWLLVITSGVTETVKRVFLLRSTSVTRKRVVYAVAFLTGITAAAFGFVMAGDKYVPSYYWATFGVVVGPLANFLHWASLGVIAWKFPGLAAALKGKR